MVIATFEKSSKMRGNENTGLAATLPQYVSSADQHAALVPVSMNLQKKMISVIKHIAIFVLFVTIPSCSALHRQQEVEIQIATSASKLLPRTVVPSHYKLKLEPYFSEGYFNGSVEINVKCQQQTNTIVLHSHETQNVNNDEITVRSDAVGENLPIASISRNKTADALIIVLQNELQLGSTYKLHIAFNSSFSETDIGFFRGKDEISSENEKWYGVTVMYPNFARRVFPCFDEPSFKATFQITVAHSNNMKALSMMPLDHTEPAEREGWVWDTFAVSPPVATYAVNLVVAQLDSDTPINVPNKGGNLILQFHHKRNHAIPGETNLTTYTHQFLERIIEYFDVAYPFPKIDFVYLPAPIDHQNSLGLLIGGTQYADGGLPAIHGFILHYFTQVSTPEGWTDFRILNILTSYLFDTTWWKILNREFYYRLFSLRRFEFQYKKLFDIPSYSVIGGEWFFHMLNFSLTENTMRRGLARLITPNNSKTYTVESIWTALTEQGREDGTLVGSVNVSTIARSWLESKCQCFPVVTVTRHYDERTAFLEQHIYFHEVDHNTTQEEEETVWWLPVEYLTPQQQYPSPGHAVVWMDEKHIIINNLPDSDSFIIVNPMGSGYFLVNYDHHNWELITQYVLTPSSVLPPETRVKLLNDAFFLAYGGKLSYTVSFNLTLSLHNETNPSMWRTLVRAINFVRNRYYWSPIEDKINSYLRILMSKMYDSIDTTDDLPAFQKIDPAEVTEIQDLMCLIEYQPCISKLNENLTKEMSTFQIYDNTTHLNIVCPAFITSTSADWLQEFVKLLSYLNTRTYIENKVYVKNLGKCPGYGNIVERILSDVFVGNFNFTSRDWSSIVRLLVNNPVSHNISLNFLLQNLDHMNEILPAFVQEWPNFLNALFSRMTTYIYLEKLLEIKERYGNQLSADSIRHLNWSLKEARVAAAWYSKSASDINNWIENVPPHFNITG